MPQSPPLKETVLATKGHPDGSADMRGVHVRNDQEKNVQDNIDDSITKEFQHGVQRVQGVTQLWGTKQLVMVYIFIWVVQLLQSLSSNIFKTMTPFVTSSFSKHSLTATTTIIASLISGLIILPYAKMMDVWGRPQSLAVMVSLQTLGIIMMAACKNVETYCAAQVFYQVGYSGVQFCIVIFVADTSSMRNRALMLAVTSSSTLGIVWGYGPITTAIMNNVGMKWGFGMWAIIMPIVYLPLIVLFYYYQRKAEKQGLVSRVDSGRTFLQSFRYYARELDLIGLLILATGMGFFLLALSLYSYQTDQWRSPMIISFIVIGPLLVVAFVFYEAHFAPVSFIPWEMMHERTVPFAYLMSSSLACASYVWISNYISALIILWNLGITTATYIGNIQLVGAVSATLVVGVILRFYGRVKRVALLFGMPLVFLGVGLVIHFRWANSPVGYVAMCQVFIAFGMGTMGICQQLALMSVATQQQLPALIATEELLVNCGISIGTAISASIWTSVYHEKLAEYLPPEALPKLPKIYGDLLTQLSYPKGSPTRNGIDHAYSESLRMMLITSLCIYVITFVAVLCWRDLDTKKMHRVHGRVV